MNDNLIYYMNLQYMYCQIYISQVIIIQKHYRSYKDRVLYNLMKHKYKMNDLLEDIIEISYMPPVKDIELLKDGGYNYREGLESFNEYKNRLSDNI